MTLGAVALLVASYLAGSMPWGYWIVRVFRKVDIRTLGSGNTGATNVWRTYGPRLGIPTLALDMAKGIVPALIGRYWVGNDTIAVLAGASAVVGHTFPIFLGLGGGKGVATAAGAMLALAPWSGVAALVTFVVMLWLFRYVSLASLSGAAAALIVAFALDLSWPVKIYGCFAMALLLWRHRANLSRLFKGTEPKVLSFGRGRSTSGATGAG
jgi:glycerol-3-phosphate acyltransferase PlsY